MKFFFIILSFFILSKSEAQTFFDSFGNVFKIDSLATSHKKHSIIKPVTIATAYAGVTLFCYRFLDDEVHEIAQRWQNKTVSAVSKTYGSLGLGSSNVIITAGTGITALVTKNKSLKKYLCCLLQGIL